MIGSLGSILTAGFISLKLSHPGDFCEAAQVRLKCKCDDFDFDFDCGRSSSAILSGSIVKSSETGALAAGG